MGALEQTVGASGLEPQNMGPCLKIALGREMNVSYARIVENGQVEAVALIELLWVHRVLDKVRMRSKDGGSDKQCHRRQTHLD
jgi:hypothetical protein